jgi:TP901 family phage tail tape measure protein
MPGFVGNIAITSEFNGAGVAAARAQFASLNAQVAATQGQLATMGKGAAAPGFAESIRKHQLALRMFGHDAQMVGQTIFRWVTLPLGVVSVVTAKMAYDFNKSMTKVQALTGTSTEMMGEYNTAVLELSKSTGVMPTNVAEGLYFIASSGFKGASALKILTQSTRLAATGMGDMMFMGQTLTSAMTAWGEKTLSAAEAADTLVAAVREGKAEPDEFSRSLGRVIPVASQVGIKFQEVAAAIAAMTNIGMSARISTFALRTLLTSFLKPQKPLIEGLKEVGLTVPKVVKQMTTEGFLPAMETIYKATHGSATKITRMFTQNAATAFLALFRSADKTKGIFARTLNSAGDALKAFNIAMESPAAKFRVALANLSAAAIVLGNKLLPIFTRIVGWVGGLVSWFNRLSSSTQAWVGYLSLSLVIFGGLLSGIGKISTGITGLAGLRGIFSGVSQVGIGATASTVSTAATAADTAAKQANAAATAGQTAARAGLISAISTETTFLTAGQAAYLRSEVALIEYQAAQANLVAAKSAAVSTTLAETEALNALAAAQARASALTTEAIASQNAYAASTARLAGVQTEQSVVYLAGLQAQAAATAAMAAEAQAAAGIQGEAALAASAATRIQTLAGTNLLVARANVGRAAASSAAASVASTAALTEEAAAMNTLKGAATGAGFALGGFGKTIGVLLALAAAAYIVNRAINHIATTAERARTNAAVVADSSGKLLAWSERVLKGHFVVTGGELVWRPHLTADPIPDIATLVRDWSRTEAAIAAQKTSKENLTTQTELAKTVARGAYDLFINAQQEITGMGRAAQRAGRGLNASEVSRVNALKYIMRTQNEIYETATAAVDNYGKRTKDIEHKFTPIIIKARIADISGEVKKAENQVRVVRKAMKAAKPGTDLYFNLQVKEQDALDAVALLRGEIRRLQRENKPILLEAKIAAAKKNVETLQHLVNRLKARDIKNKVTFQADTRMAMIKLRTAQEQAEKFAGTYKGVITVAVKKAPQQKDLSKILGLPNWVQEGTVKSASVSIKADAKDALAKARNVTDVLATVGSITATPKINTDASGVYSGVVNATSALNTIDGKTVTTYIKTVTLPGQEAFGGIYNLHSATSFVAGEAGPEVAAFFPMNNPTRSANLLAQLNAQMGGSSKTSSSTASKAVYNVNVLVPGGTTLIGTAREVGEILAPHVERALARAEARGGRRR